ncbi:Uncharacterized protein M6B38_224965 [Iris pallida]|uniref:Secreted protein n=1 Tax=Iris pallida TaxID=29817 RepID=A0AAX6DVX4_IRIPA|nr:Uncharacterized protein M6B38_224965 [Iris pallida]
MFLMIWCIYSFALLVVTAHAFWLSIHVRLIINFLDRTQAALVLSIHAPKLAWGTQATSTRKLKFFISPMEKLDFKSSPLM